MISVCPNCGHVLSRALNDGFTICGNCNKIFDTSTFNRLSAAAWMLQREPHLDMNKLKHETKLSDEEIILTYAFFHAEYSVQEFQKALKDFGIVTNLKLGPENWS